MQKLPSYLQNEMFYQYELDPNNDINMDFEDLLIKTIGLLVARKKLVSLV